MAGSHITEQHIAKSQGFVQLELLNMTPYKPQAYDLHQNYELDSLKNLKDLNILSKKDDATNNVTKPAISVLN